MKLSKVKTLLPHLESLTFKLQDGQEVPKYFHITEVGMVHKSFIDCGGTVRSEKKVNFQLWYSIDTDHRLEPTKLLKIIELSEKTLNLEDADIEVEYQTETIGKYELDFDGHDFILKPTSTACLAMDACGIPAEKPRIKLSQIVGKNVNTCSPNSGCC